MLRFWKALADNTYDGELPDTDWILETLWNEDHPVSTCLNLEWGNQPFPPSAMDRMLRDIYAPALREQLNRMRPITKMVNP